MATNDATICRNEAAVTNRTAEYSNQTELDFDGGMNLAASNAPGIGIASTVVNTSEENWTLLDQTETARTPQKSQHIGGSGEQKVDPQPQGFTDSYSATYVVTQLDENGENGDFNDEAHYVTVVAGPVAPGAPIDGGSVINNTGTTLQTGDVVWGRVPV